MRFSVTLTGAIVCAWILLFFPSLQHTTDLPFYDVVLSTVIVFLAIYAIVQYPIKLLQYAFLISTVCAFVAFLLLKGQALTESNFLLETIAIIVNPLYVMFITPFYGLNGLFHLSVESFVLLIAFSDLLAWCVVKATRVLAKRQLINTKD